MTVLADLGFGGVGVEIVAAVDAQKVHQSDTDGVFGTGKTAPGAKNAVIAESKLSVLILNIIHGTTLDAKSALDAFFFIDMEQQSVKAHARAFDPVDGISYPSAERYFFRFLNAGDDLLRVGGDPFASDRIHFARHRVGMTKDHVVGHYIMIFRAHGITFFLQYLYYRFGRIVVERKRLAGRLNDVRVALSVGNIVYEFDHVPRRAEAVHGIANNGDPRPLFLLFAAFYDGDGCGLPQF